MKIVLVGNYENDGLESMQRFAVFMRAGLTRAGHEVRIARPSALFGRLRPSAIGIGKWLGYVDKFACFPGRLKSQVAWPDIVHICDHANAFYTKYLRGVPHVITCHDLLPVRSARGEIPQNPTGWTGRQLQRMILKGLTQSQHVVCVSNSTRTDLLRLSGISEQRVSCVYNSLNYPYLPMHEFEAVRRLRNLRLDPNRPFLLHVGGNQWYKNRLGVLQTFSRLRNLTGRQTLRLVMVGKPWTTEMRQFVLENSMTDLTTELVAVADEDLRALYSTATMMLFPSLHEGFGWPIIEAQACGCPVATSKRPPMDEIAGRAAIYIDPENADSAAAILHQSLAGVSDLRESSIANAARFRSGMIEGYLSLYEKLCREKTLSSAGVLDKLTTGSSVWSAGGLQ